jgi:dTDP-glucose 4,6-dehydratase
MKKILITGGAGFIGSHVVKLFLQKYPTVTLVNIDKLTYAGNLENLKEIEAYPNYVFVKGDICDRKLVKSVFSSYAIDTVVHLAAESHVDRSIESPFEFVQTNIMGTLVLLNQAKESWEKDFSNKLFYHVSTDEVFGSLEETGLFSETTAYDPKSPYAASKASSDHFVKAYQNTYGLPTIISNCSNNYGPNQFPEKLIPLVVHRILNNQSIPVYGQGLNVRDWLYVEDHARAIDLILNKGELKQTYAIGGGNEWTNIDLVKLICRLTDSELGYEAGTSEKQINFVKDRAGHDKRYAMDSSKLADELGWKPTVSFEEGIKKTIRWYLRNQAWLENVVNGSYQEYYKKQYNTKS